MSRFAVLFDATRPVKPSRPFGAEVLPMPPVEPPAPRPERPAFPRLAVATLDDRQWWAAQSLGGPDATDYAIEGEPRRLRFQPKPDRRLSGFSDRDAWNRGRC